jgi:hypothetical protein
MQCIRRRPDSVGCDARVRRLCGQDSYISVLSVCNGLGRLAIGFATDSLEKHVSRPFFCVVSLLLLTFGHISLCFLNLHGLYFGFGVTGAT